MPPFFFVQTSAANSQEELSSRAQQVAAQVQPAADQAGETLLDAAQLVQQGATQQGQQLAGRIEDAGQALGGWAGPDLLQLGLGW